MLRRPHGLGGLGQRWSTQQQQQQGSPHGAGADSAAAVEAARHRQQGGSRAQNRPHRQRGYWQWQWHSLWVQLVGPLLAQGLLRRPSAKGPSSSAPFSSLHMICHTPLRPFTCSASFAPLTSCARSLIFEYVNNTDFKVGLGSLC